MLLVCPRHGKSLLGSQRYPAYALGRNPQHDIICASATAALAEDFGREVRNLIASQEYRAVFPDTTLAEDSQARGQWRTQVGGAYYAVGVGGAIMGRGATRLVIDDPFASMEDAQSALARNRVWDWYRATAYNRLHPGGAIVLICHRMHEDDLAGRLLASQDSGDKWTVVELAANDPQPLWPERFGADFYARLKAVTPPLHWSALYLQRPQPEEGTFFRREWFWRYRPDEVPAVRKYVTSDFAVTEKQDADYTEIGVHGLVEDDAGLKVYAGLDGWFGKKDPSAWLEEYLRLVKAHRPLAEFGESGVIQKAVEPFLQRRRTQTKAFGSVEWLPSIVDKQARAASLRAMASMGLIGLPHGDYGEHLLECLVGFPMAKHDDAVDMLSLMARAIDQAHPALGKKPPEPEKRDAYDRAFGRNEGRSSWRT